MYRAPLKHFYKISKIKTLPLSHNYIMTYQVYNGINQEYVFLSLYIQARFIFIIYSRGQTMFHFLIGRYYNNSLDSWNKIPTIFLNIL